MWPLEIKDLIEKSSKILRLSTRPTRDKKEAPISSQMITTDLTHQRIFFLNWKLSVTSQAMVVILRINRSRL